MKSIDVLYKIVLGAAIMASVFCSAQVSTAPFWEIDPNDGPAWESAMCWSGGITAILIFLRAVAWRFVEDIVRRGAGLSGSGLVVFLKCVTVVCAMVFLVGLVGMEIANDKVEPYSGLSAEERLAAWPVVEAWSKVWIGALAVGGVCYFIIAVSNGYITQAERDEMIEESRPLPGHTCCRTFASFEEADSYRRLHGYKPGYAFKHHDGTVGASFKYRDTEDT